MKLRTIHGVEELRNRNLRIYRMRNEGFTLQRIADRYSLTKERIRQICAREKRREK